VRRKLLLTIVVAVLVGPAAYAEDGVPALDEAAFVAALERTDPRLERLAADVAMAEADVVAAGVRPNPELALDREEVFPDGGGSATSYARLVWPFDLAGRRGRRVDAARASARAASAEGETARFALIVDGLRVFDDAAYARLHVDLLRAERDALTRAVEIVRKRTRAGAASGYDAQRIELELAAYDDLIASAEIELAAARARLGALVGQPAADATATLELPGEPADTDALVDGAVERRGDYRAARLRGDAAAALDALERRGWIPDLGVSVGAMTADVGDETALGYTVGLSISLPIFDRGQADGARAKAARRAAEAERRVLEVTVPANVRVARETLSRRIAQSRELATQQLARLDDLLRAAETGYREGATGVVELLDAYRTARETRLRDLELRRDARLAERDLWLALGRRP
jgi:outer membrane protein, heavy metal efflux system